MLGDGQRAKAEARGREQVRKQVVALIEEHYVQLPPDILRELNGDADPN